jgi:hypothetical protein
MPYHIGVGGAWKLANKAHVGVGGVWKQVQKMYIGVGGVWKEFYSSLEVFLVGYSANRVSVSPVNAAAEVELLNTGVCNETTIGGGTSTFNWLISGSAADVDMYLSGTGSALTAGSSPLNTWISGSTGASWGLLVTLNGDSKTWNGTIQFRDATTLAVIGSCPLTLDAEKTL